MKSSYITWILEQNLRQDNVGIISRWILDQPEFEPVEFHDILEKTKDEELRSFAIESLVEYAGTIIEEGAIIKIIDDEEIDKERLNIALKHENYEEAAELRDRLNAIYQSNCKHDRGYITNDGPSRCVTCGKPWP